MAAAGAENTNGGGFAGVVLADDSKEKAGVGLTGSARTVLTVGELVGLGAVKANEGAGVEAPGRPSPIPAMPLPAVGTADSAGFLGMAKKSGTGVDAEDDPRLREGFDCIGAVLVNAEAFKGAAANGEDARGRLTPAASKKPRTLRTAVTSTSFFFLGEGLRTGAGIETG